MFYSFGFFPDFSLSLILCSLNSLCLGLGFGHVFSFVFSVLHGSIELMCDINSSLFLFIHYSLFIILLHYSLLFQKFFCYFLYSPSIPVMHMIHFFCICPTVFGYSVPFFQFLYFCFSVLKVSIAVISASSEILSSAVLILLISPLNASFISVFLSLSFLFDCFFEF